MDIVALLGYILWFLYWLARPKSICLLKDIEDVANCSLMWQEQFILAHIITNIGYCQTVTFFQCDGYKIIHTLICISLITIEIGHSFIFLFYIFICFFLLLFVCFYFFFLLSCYKKATTHTKQIRKQKHLVCLMVI